MIFTSVRKLTGTKKINIKDLETTTIVITTIAITTAIIATTREREPKGDQEKVRDNKPLIINQE